MYKIVFKKELAPKIKLIGIHAPEVAKAAKPGQYVILRIDDKGERFPLTIANNDTTPKGIVALVFNEVGRSTKQLGTLNEGSEILDLAGPLGIPSEIQNFGKILCVGGGVLIAPLYSVALALKKAGNNIIGIIGARSKGLLIYKEEMKAICDEFYTATDDGSDGYSNLNFMKDILDEKNINRVITMGPIATIKTVSEISKPYGIKTIVTLTPIMVDATGMCGCCRVLVGGKTKFACVDGPEFDGHEVDFNLLTSRLRMYGDQEKQAMERYKCECT